MEHHNSTSRRCYTPTSSELKVVSANLRGFHTNIGELTHSVIVKNSVDLVFVCETFLDDKVPVTYARVKGYSTWIRKDRFTQGGGIAFCHKESLNVQVVELPLPAPSEIELVALKIIDGNGKGLLCVGCYRPPRQGSVLLDYLTGNIDTMMTANQCESVVVLGDLNQHLVQDAFNTLLVVHNLHNYVTFPTHRSGSSLDPVVTDLPHHSIQCFPLDFVGTSDHVAVLTKIQFRKPREESFTRTLWRWEAANWEALRADLKTTVWRDVLSGDVDQQVQRLSKLLHDLQLRWVPHSAHTTKASDQPWFGPECRAAAETKYRAWRALKRHPNARTRQRHREAAARMIATQEWAREEWKANLRSKLRGGQIGNKRWWSLVKDEQGETRGCSVPALIRPDGSLAQSSEDKANLLAAHYAGKMCVADPDRPPHVPPQLVSETIMSVKTSAEEVRVLLRDLDEKKAVGPDSISPHLLRQCAEELAPPLATIFNNSFRSSMWPTMWKVSSVVPIHKKNSKSEVKNYRPVSLLPVLSKVLETIVVSRLTRHLEKHHVMSTRQYGFRQGRSAGDLHLQLSTEWSAALDEGKAAAVVALDIEGAFDKVWHAALVSKLRAAGVEGPLLKLLESYLRDRHFKVSVNGRESRLQPIRAGVPQGSCLGPLLWNLYINDLLHLIPNTRAYADDITLSLCYGPEEESATASLLNATLSRIAAWGKKWQVRFAAHKTQLLNISRTRAAPHIMFQGDTLTPQDEVEVLGVTYDSKLTFKSHIERLAREASGKLASLRRMAHILDSRGIEVLYKAQVRSSLEYACLAWGGAASKHLALLDKVQDRAARLIRGEEGDQAAALQTLQHRRDVAGLTVMFKIQQQCVPHLQSLRQPARQAQVATRAVTLAPEELQQPRCRTWHHQRQFVYKYVGWWNKFLANEENFLNCSTQQFKCKVNAWLLHNRQ